MRSLNLKNKIRVQKTAHRRVQKIQKIKSENNIRMLKQSLTNKPGKKKNKTNEY
jgi:hypothetical protein